MPTRTLPLAALRAFEAAARHVSYSRAAEELGLTHGAISFQMRVLKAELGVDLFKRSGRRMVLTPEGQRLFGYVRDGFARFEQGMEDVRAARRGQMLTVSVHPGLASYWVIPRLGDFQRKHPEIDVSLLPNTALVDFSRDDIDMALRYGPGGWPGLVAVKLMDEEVFPVCSPRFNGGVLPKQPRDLAALPLLRDARQPWSDWFKSIGLDLPEPERGPVYNEPSLVLQAAIAGQGVALARGALVRPAIEAGHLVRLFPRGARARFSYYIVYPPAAASIPRITAFRDWLLSQAGEQQAN
jgi:LysR family transcriptional regulator, glycine cleavage system transcriptional activator